MPFHLYRVWSEGEEARCVGIHVTYDEDRWSAVCHEAGAQGEEIAGGAITMPRFYGVTAEQALRRMLEVLENTFDEVVPAEMGKKS